MVSPLAAESEHRLWDLDLGTTRSYRQLRTQDAEVAQAASVAFVDANTLAVTYRIAGTGGVSFLDANLGLGELRESLKWRSHDRFPTDRNFIRLLPTRDGEFLIVVGRSIRGYSRWRRELTVRSLPFGGPGSWEWVVRVCPNGRTPSAVSFNATSYRSFACGCRAWTLPSRRSILLRSFNRPAAMVFSSPFSATSMRLEKSAYG
jgi:hypothetical protein